MQRSFKIVIAHQLTIFKITMLEGRYLYNANYKDLIEKLASSAHFPELTGIANFQKVWNESSIKKLKL